MRTSSKSMPRPRNEDRCWPASPARDLRLPRRSRRSSAPCSDTSSSIDTYTPRYWAISARSCSSLFTLAMGCTSGRGDAIDQFVDDVIGSDALGFRFKRQTQPVPQAVMGHRLHVVGGDEIAIVQPSMGAGAGI